MAFSLDHVGIAVRDLDRAADLYRRLGFMLAERGYHTRPSATPGGAPERVGTGNHCMMLRHGYLEVIGITDPALYKGRLRDDLARYEGLQIVALGCDDAKAAVAQLRRNGAKAAEARVLNRPIEERGASGLAAFAIIELMADLPEAYFIAIQQLTPDLLWQPHLLDHPNGAQSLKRVTVCVADPAEMAARIGRLLGIATTAEALGSHVVPLGANAIDLVDPAELARRYAGGTPPSLPWVAGITLGVANPQRASDAARAAGFSSRQSCAGLWLPPEEACGAVLEFVAA
jgi:catechol 2,3-dioxygenase-like lactoylglutathione lyase family enzyme